MQCLILFRDASGWLPTAQEMRRCGFCVSAAALPTPNAAPNGAAPDGAAEAEAKDSGLALAAEPVGEYGVKPALAPALGQTAKAGQA